MAEDGLRAVTAFQDFLNRNLEFDAQRFWQTPDRQRKTTWKEFLRSHWNVLAATDFFSVEVWTAFGLVRYHVLFVIRLATREVHIAGIIPEPHGR